MIRFTQEMMAEMVREMSPTHAPIPLREQNPYVTHYGKITDGPKFTAWEMARMASERA